MLKSRLVAGVLMTLFFIGLVVGDGWLDGSLTASECDDLPVRGSVVAVLVAILVVWAERELSGIAWAKGLRVLAPVTTVAAVVLATVCYWRQWAAVPESLILFIFTAPVLLGLMWYQYLRWGLGGMLANCGVSYFSIIYLGAVPSFVLAIRVYQGLWHLLMFVFVVKAADIGAYTVGSLAGRHKFSPVISPRKTWEGMAGAIAAGVIVAMVFAAGFGIMRVWQAAVFGLSFAFIGQSGDLAESMLKRDACVKDSAASVPGFGGILDVIDSPVLAAPFAYMFFEYVCV